MDLLIPCAIGVSLIAAYITNTHRSVYATIVIIGMRLIRYVQIVFHCAVCALKEIMQVAIGVKIAQIITAILDATVITQAAIITMLRQDIAQSVIQHANYAVGGVIHPVQSV